MFKHLFKKSLLNSTWEILEKALKFHRRANNLDFNSMQIRHVFKLSINSAKNLCTFVLQNNPNPLHFPKKTTNLTFLSTSKKITQRPVTADPQGFT